MTAETTPADVAAEARPTMECPHCREMILEGARICRFCNRRVGRPNHGLAVAAGLIILVGLIGFVVWNGGLDIGKVWEAKVAVRAKLSDPGTARFRHVKVYRRWDAQFQTVFDNTCGEVNSKNRMGGYVGFARFIHLSGSVVLMEPIDPSGTDDGRWFEDFWAKTCVNRPRGGA